MHLCITTHLVDFLGKRNSLFSEKRCGESVGYDRDALARENKSAEKAEILSFKSADIKSVMKLRNKGEV